MTDEKPRQPTIKEAATSLRGRLIDLDGHQTVWNPVQTALSEYDLDTYQGAKDAQARLQRLYNSMLQVEVALSALIGALGRKATSLNPAAPDLLQAANRLLSAREGRYDLDEAWAILAEAIDYYSEKEIDQ